MLAQPCAPRAARPAAARMCKRGARLAGRPCRRMRVVRAAADEGSNAPQSGLAPAQPRTAHGEMLAYYLKMEPQLFKAAIDDQFRRLSAEKEAKEAQAVARQQLPPPEAAGGEEGTPSAAGAAATGSDLDQQAPPEHRSPSELVLYERMQEVQAGEMRATLEDLLYLSILEKFLVLGVDMLPRLDGFVDEPQANLKALTEGIHSQDALELVRDHLLGVMGAAAGRAFSTELIKMSKFQMAQVYAASVMFGYFLRRVDRRFALERQLGLLPEVREEAVARLERLFAAAADMDEGSDPDTADPDAVYVVEPPASSSGSGSGSGADKASSSTAAGGGEEQALRRQKSALRQYVEGFDQATMVDTARIVSVEGAALVERQTSALFGDIKQLTAQMQEAVGRDISSPQELYARLQAAVMGDAVETVTMSVGTQRRCVLEAVAFGTFLRDVEDQVQGEWHLLTPMAAPQLPPGLMSDDD